MLFCPQCRSLLARRADGDPASRACPQCGWAPGRAALRKADGARFPGNGPGREMRERGSVASRGGASAARSEAGAALPAALSRFFPFETVREGQREFMLDAYAALSGGTHLLAHAPTGVGKTVSSLVAAIAVGRETRRKVFFLTSKQTQHRIAVETLKAIRASSGEDLFVVDLIAKRDMCPRPEAKALPGRAFAEFCAREQARKECAHFRNALHAEKGVGILRDRVLHVEEAVRLLDRQVLCPHHIALESAREADVVLCDYNHLFSDMRDGFTERLELDLGRAIVVVDEAHNLPDRIRDHLTLEVSESILDEAEAELARIDASAESRLVAAVRGAFQELVDSRIFGNPPRSPDPLARGGATPEGRPSSSTAAPPSAAPRAVATTQAGSSISQDHRTAAFPGLAPDVAPAREEALVPREAWMEAVARHLVRLRGLLTAATYEDLARTLRESALEFERRERSQAEALVRVAQFLENWRIERRGLLRLLRKDRLGQWVLVYQLLDPAILARPVFDTVSASILMSGTLSPAEATREVLGLAPERSVLEEYASPFARENRLVLLDSEVTTAFQDRSDAMFERIAAHLGQTSEAVPGHMAAFFPSYALLENVRRRLDCAREVVVEERGIGKEERERLVGALRSSRRAGSGEPKLLLGVLGGGLSEGYDYEDNLLRAVAIVGLPLAPPSLEQDARIRYATERFGAKGKLYSYVVPSMNRVLQAAGRLIRGPEDHGVILLMDKRFGWNEYRGCMPKDFAPRPTDAPGRDVRVFFRAREASAST